MKTLYFAWILCLFGIGISVYNSEILGVEPCRLCWIQRCALFPLGILLGVALYRGDDRFASYGLILSGAGAAVALTQVFFPTSLCAEGCAETATLIWFFTLPMISAVGFGAIFILLYLSMHKKI